MSTKQSLRPTVVVAAVVAEAALAVAVEVAAVEVTEAVDVGTDNQCFRKRANLYKALSQVKFMIKTP